MKQKLLLLFIIAQINFAATYAQDPIIVDSVKVPIKTQLNKLFQPLNLKEVTSGLLEEKSYTPLTPSYFKGEGSSYTKPSSKQLLEWQVQRKALELILSKDKKAYPSIRKNLFRMDSLLTHYFVPAIQSGKIPLMENLKNSTTLYETLLASLNSYSNCDIAYRLLIKQYDQLLDKIPGLFIQAYSPQYLEANLKNENAANFEIFKILYDGMYQAAIDTFHRPLISPDSYNSKVRSVSSAIPLCVMHLDYHTINENALKNHLLTYSNGSFHDVPHRKSSPYQLQKLVSVVSAQDTVIGQANFIWESELVASNQSKKLLYIEVDFDNDNGYVKVNPNTPITVSYSTTGDKDLKYILVYSDGSVSIAHSGLYAKANMMFASLAYNANNPDITWTSVGIKTYQGGVTSANISVSLGCGNSQIRKPLIVLEGFDPTNEINYNYFITQLNNTATTPNALSDLLRNSGYDIIYVDFNNTTDYIQRNAFLVEKVIQDVIARRQGNEPIAVLGISMGGLIGRYALRDMENTGINHQTNLFVTFDTPHLGANVPLGFQYMFRDVSQDLFFFNISQLNFGKKLLTSPAAQQMLITQAYATGNLVHTQFMAELAGLGNGGFPALTRNVAISNGSIIGRGEPFVGGSDLLSISGNSITTFKKPLYKLFGFLASMILQTRYVVNIKVKAMPSTGNVPFPLYTANIFIQILGIPLVAKSVVYFSVPNYQYDSAPGGYYDISDIAGAITSAQGYVNVSLQSRFCFVPTLSALNISSAFPGNLYVNVSALNPVATNKTNFKEIAGNTSTSGTANDWNEFHTQFSSYNNQLLTNELVNRVSHQLINNSPYYLTNNTYNFGANTINRSRSIVVQGSSASLSINANKATGLGPIATGAVPVTGSSFFVSVDGANNCSDYAKIDVKSSGQMVIGDINGNKGTLEVRDQASVLIENTSILTIQNQSTLHIVAGGTLVVKAGATLILNGSLIVDAGGYICIEQGATFTAGPNANLAISTNAISGANSATGISTNNCTIPTIQFCTQTYSSSNEALHFDGIDDYVDVPETNGTLNFGTSDFTFEALIKSDEIGFGGDIQMILSKRNYYNSNGTVDGFMWGIWPSGQIYAQLNDVPNIGYNQGPSVLDGNCHYIALVRQNNVLKFFIDGTQTYSQSVSPLKDISSAGSFRIGNNHISGVSFQGLIGEVRVWNKAYIPSTTGLITGSSTNLMGYWDFTGASSQTVADLSGRNNNGTLGSTNTCDDNDPLWVTQGQLACNYQGNFRVAGASFIDNSTNTESIQIAAFPNPYTDYVDISVQGYSGNLSVVVKEINGNIVFENNNYFNEAPLIFGDNLANGVYFVEVTAGDFVKNIKLVKTSK